MAYVSEIGLVITHSGNTWNYAHLKKKQWTIRIDELIYDYIAYAKQRKSNQKFAREQKKIEQNCAHFMPTG